MYKRQTPPFCKIRRQSKAAAHTRRRAGDLSPAAAVDRLSLIHIFDILSHAERYVRIFTPYLILDETMVMALTLAAKRGVDVELINDLPADAHISFYKQGEFVDLCAGPHLDSTGRIKGCLLYTSRCV